MMSQKIRNFQKNLLIVCEGENSEPNYYGKLGELAQKNGIWDKVTISPEPKILAEQKEEENIHKTKRKTREFKKPIATEDYQIEEEYKAYPTRFVRQAQKGLEDDIYMEVWAVFDKDYHPRHEEAFELANREINGKKVNIAFSSISFEHWVILHFERNKTAFHKSECKDDKDNVINCGCSTSDQDCEGEKCAIGYLKAKKLVPQEINIKGSQTDLYALLSDKETIAKENASWLRYEVRDQLKTLPFYQLNPYTTNDLLLKKLKGDGIDIIWSEIGEQITTPSFRFKLIYRIGLFAILEFENYSNSVVFNNQNINTFFEFKSIDGKAVSFDIWETKVFRANESGNIILRLYNNGITRFTFNYLEYKVLIEHLHS